MAVKASQHAVRRTTTYGIAVLARFMLIVLLFVLCLYGPLVGIILNCPSPVGIVFKLFFAKIAKTGFHQGIKPLPHLTNKEVEANSPHRASWQIILVADDLHNSPAEVRGKRKTGGRRRESCAKAREHHVRPPCNTFSGSKGHGQGG